MKRNKTILCAVLSAVLLASCSSDKTETQETAVTEISPAATQPVTSVQETEKAVVKPTENITFSKNNQILYPKFPVNEEDLPLMAASDSELPFEARIRAKLLDIGYKHALSNISDSGTHSAVQSLLSGEADLIFSEPLSVSQQREADNAGVNLNIIPVANEGLVFIVSKDNPVSSLTREQIRDIYSGKITNWSELGGTDTEIVPYQRNADTVSQKYMNKFMEGHDFSEPEVYLYAPELESISNYVCVDTYTSSPEAIGYAYGSIAVRMCENSDSVKMVAVDGVVPSYKTVSDGTYPLSNSISLIHRDNPSEKTSIFIKWICSDTGQQYLNEIGYFPVKRIYYPEDYKLYETKGTGKKMPDNFTPSRYVSVIQGSEIYDIDLSFIKDEELRESIKNDFEECRASLISEGYKTVKGCSFYGENGYITFSQDGMHYELQHTYRQTKSFTYDIVEKKKISKFSDLFFKDSDFVPLINKSVSYRITNSGKWYEPLNDFIGIAGEIDEFGVDLIHSQKNNPYYTDSHMIFRNYPYQDYYLKPDYNMHSLAMVTGEYRDFRDYIINDAYNYYIKEVERPEWYTHPEIQTDAGDYYISSVLAFDSLYHTKEEVIQRNNVINKVISHVRDKYESINPLDNQKSASGKPRHVFYHADNIYNVTPECTYKTSKFYTETDYYMNIFTGFMDHSEHNNNMFEKYTFFDHHYVGYDPETGEPLTFADVFGPEFSDIDESYILYTYSVSFEPDSSDCVRFIYGEPYIRDGETQIIEIPVNREHLNMKYFIPAADAFISTNSMTNRMLYTETPGAPAPNVVC